MIYDRASSSRDVTATIFGAATMLVHQTNPVGVKFFSYVKSFLCSNKCLFT